MVIIISQLNTTKYKYLLFPNTSKCIGSDTVSCVSLKVTPCATLAVKLCCIGRTSPYTYRAQSLTLKEQNKSFMNRACEAPKLLFVMPTLVSSCHHTVDMFDQLIQETIEGCFETAFTPQKPKVKRYE